MTDVTHHPPAHPPDVGRLRAGAGQAGGRAHVGLRGLRVQTNQGRTAVTANRAVTVN